MDDEPVVVSTPASQISEEKDTNGGETSSTRTTSSLFQDPDADIIIRTSDEVDFRVYKIILGVASPVFKTMLSLPQPIKSDMEGNIDEPDSVPVFPISESSSVFNLLLQLCYPMKAPRLDDSDVSLIGEVLAAALKYEITAVVEIAKDALRARAERSHKDAIAAYSIACHLEQEDDARATAIACLKWPFPCPTVPQLGMMSALDYHALAHFHKDSCDGIAILFRNMGRNSVTKDRYGTISSNQVCPDHKVSYHTDNKIRWIIPQWWISSMNALGGVFQFAPFDVAKLSLATLSPEILKTDCSTCREKFVCFWDSTRESIIDDMKKKIDEVELELSWK